jgi:hypothetical protein
MRWSKTCLLLLLVSPAWAIDGYVVGGGIGGDSADGLTAGLFADLGVTANTRILGSIGKSQVPLPFGIDLKTSYGDLGLDYWFDPVGVRVEVAYWGDNDIFDSKDGRAAIYWRNDKITLTGKLEYRDFEFDIFRADLLTNRDVRFHANGAGLSARFEISEAVSINFNGIDYRYNVDLSRAGNRDITNFLSVSRLSLINSLVDYRAGAGIGFDRGLSRWDIDYATWKGAVDGNITHSVTVNFLTPLGERSDIQIGLGVDDSDTYGSITFFSLNVFFYGAN